MIHPSRSGPDRTIILRIPRIDPLAQAIDLAAVRALQSPPEFIKATLTAALDVSAVAPTATRRRATQEAA